MQIFITRGEDSSGPYTPEQVQDYLAQGVLLPGDLAWHEGLEGWIPLSQLMDSIAATVDPTPPQPVAITPEPVQSGPTTESAPAKAGDKKKLLIGIGAGVAVLVIAAAVWFFVIREKDSGQQPQPKLTNIREKDSGTGNQQVTQQPQPKPTNNATSPVDPEPDKPAKKPGTVLWEFETGHQAGGPSIGNDGTVYVGSVDKKVYALDGQTGVKKWEFETGGMVISSPVIGPDNTVYVGSYDKKIYALNGKTGAKKWDFETGKPVASSPAIGADGIIYIGGWDGKVYALDAASGVKKWEFEIQNGLFSSTVVGFNNTVYAASVEVDVKNGVFCALDGKTGGKKWEHKAKKNVTTYAPTIGPAIASDNVVYLGISLDSLGDEGKLIALDGETGTVKWEFDLNCLPSPPVIGADKIIYFGTRGLSGDGLFYSVDGKSGLKKWEYKLQGDALGAAQMIASPAIGDNGTIYIGANTGRKGEVLALNGKSGAKKWALKIGAINGIVIGNDGTIYVGSLNKKVYAIKTDSKGPAKSPWPMRGQNARHTGRAIGVATTKPPEPTPPANSKLAGALINKRVGISIEGDELWIQLNKNGTTLDYKGLTGTFRIENLTLSVQDDDGITMVEFVVPNPKEGDAVTVTGTREPGSPPILGPIKAKLVTLTKINDSGPTDTIPPPPPIPNPSEPGPTKPGAVLWEFETGNYVYSSR